MSHTVQITAENFELAELKLSWRTAEFTAEDGIGSLRSLHEAGDALVAVARIDDTGTTILGSGVMVGPGLLLTATHVLDEFAQEQSTPAFLTFLPTGARAWLPHDASRMSKPSDFHAGHTVSSDVSLVSCTLNSSALAEYPLNLAPMQIALPLIGERLWAVGFRHQKIEDGAAFVTPMISSGLVTAAFPDGRGERMPSSCFEVNMDTQGGMSGGAIINANGFVVGILSSSFEGGPSYCTLIWDALHLSVKGTIPRLQIRDTVSIQFAKLLNLAKLEGDVSRNPWGEIRLKLSDEESSLLALSTSAPAHTPAMSADDKEKFLEDWSDDLTRMGAEAAVSMIESLPLDEIRNFLRASDIPEECLKAIQRFTVVDFEGADDLELISSEATEADQIALDFFFLLLTLVWTVEVSAAAYNQHADLFNKHFGNIITSACAVSMETTQRCYFRATTTFDPAQSSFSDVAITASAIRRRRSRRKSS